MNVKMSLMHAIIITCISLVRLVIHTRRVSAKKIPIGINILNITHEVMSLLHVYVHCASDLI